MCVEMDIPSGTLGPLIRVMGSECTFSVIGDLKVHSAPFLPSGDCTPNKSFKPSPHRQGHEQTIDRAGRLNSGVGLHVSNCIGFYGGKKTQNRTNL